MSNIYDKYFYKIYNWALGKTRNKEDDLITYTVAPHSFYTCSDECLEKVSKLALKYNLPVFLRIYSRNCCINFTSNIYHIAS